MRRLQSFKSPSKLNEKLKFASRGIVNNQPTLNSVKFVPNIGTNEYVDSSKQCTGKSDEPEIYYSEDKVFSEPVYHRKDNSILNDIESNDNKTLDTSKFMSTLDDTDNGLCKQQTTVSAERYNSENFRNRRDDMLLGLDSVSCTCWSIIQFPKYLPSRHCSIQGNSDESSLNSPSVLHEVPSGSIGKLVVRKSGDTQIYLNGCDCLKNVIFDVEKEVNFSEQTVFALNKISELIELGSCSSTLIVTPEVIKIDT